MMAVVLILVAVMQFLESRDFMPFDSSAVEISEYVRKIYINPCKGEQE